MPHPFVPEDFPLDEDAGFYPTKTFYLDNCIHFKTEGKVVDCTYLCHKPWRPQFSNSFIQSVAACANDAIEDENHTYEVLSCGNMMRTIKSFKDAQSGENLADLNMTFVSFGSSSVRFPKDSPHSPRDIELLAVNEQDALKEINKHEGFIWRSIPFFWDFTNGPDPKLYKGISQKRVEVARVSAYGFQKNAILVIDGDEIDDVVAVTTCIIFLNGREAIDSC